MNFGRSRDRGVAADGRASGTALVLPALQALTTDLQMLVLGAFLDGVRCGEHLESYDAFDEFTIRALHGEFWSPRTVEEHVGGVPHTVATHLADALDSMQRQEGLSLANLFTVKETVAS